MHIDVYTQPGSQEQTLTLRANSKRERRSLGQAFRSLLENMEVYKVELHRAGESLVMRFKQREAPQHLEEVTSNVTARQDVKYNNPDDVRTGKAPLHPAAARVHILDKSWELGEYVWASTLTDYGRWATISGIISAITVMGVGKTRTNAVLYPLVSDDQGHSALQPLHVRATHLCRTEQAAVSLTQRLNDTQDRLSPQPS